LDEASRNSKKGDITLESGWCIGNCQKLQAQREAETSGSRQLTITGVGVEKVTEIGSWNSAEACQKKVILHMFCLILIVGRLLIMMGQHDRSEALFYYFRLEDQVPETHLLCGSSISTSALPSCGKS
jgi:hypothetical protein